MGLIQLLYVSDAIDGLVAEDLRAIQSVSQLNNSIFGITGILFFAQGHFVQFLEGEPFHVRRLFKTIVQDPRHHSVKLLYDRPARVREFEDWDMALLDLDDYSEQHRMDLQDLIHMAGYQVRDEGDQPMDLIILRRFRELLATA